MVLETTAKNYSAWYLISRELSNKIHCPLQNQTKTWQSHSRTTSYIKSKIHIMQHVKLLIQHPMEAVNHMFLMLHDVESPIEQGHLQLENSGLLQILLACAVYQQRH